MSNTHFYLMRSVLVQNYGNSKTIKSNLKGCTFPSYISNIIYLTYDFDCISIVDGTVVTEDLWNNTRFFYKNNFIRTSKLPKDKYKVRTSPGWDFGDCYNFKYGRVSSFVFRIKCWHLDVLIKRDPMSTRLDIAFSSVLTWYSYHFLVA